MQTPSTGLRRPRKVPESDARSVRVMVMECGGRGNGEGGGGGGEEGRRTGELELVESCRSVLVR